jgi:hypothetical protein
VRHPLQAPALARRPRSRQKDHRSQLERRAVLDPQGARRSGKYAAPFAPVGPFRVARAGEPSRSPRSVHHQVQIEGGSPFERADGGERAIETHGLAPDGQVLGPRGKAQRHSDPIDERDPALDAGEGRERAVLRHLREADAKEPVLRRRPGEEFARGPAPVAPGLRLDVVRIDQQLIHPGKTII